MRRTRRLLTSDSAEVPEREAKAGDGAGVFSLDGRESLFDVVSALPEQCDGEGGEMAPPLKRFKLPDTVLARLGKAPTCSGEKVEVDGAGDGDNNEVAGVIREKKLAAAKRSAASANGEAVRGKRPVVSVRRIPRHQFEQQQQLQENMTSLPREYFANSNDDVIRFGTSGPAADSESSSSSVSSSVCSEEGEGDTNKDRSAAIRAAKLKREIDRHFEAYENDDFASCDNFFLEEEEEVEEEVEEEDVDADEGEEVEEDESSDNEGDNGVENTDSKPGQAVLGFGLLERRRQQQLQTKALRTGEDNVASKPTNDTGCQRFRYSSMFFEMHIGREGTNPCHHTLLCVNGPITIQGPCGIIGFGIGEVAIGGFFLGKKQVALLSDKQRVVLMPVSRIKSKNAGLESLPVPISFKQSDGPVTLVPSTKGSDADDVDENDDDVDMFGTIDWDWVETTVTSWQGRFVSKMPSIVLVVQPYDPCGVPPTRRHYFKQQENKSADDSFVDLPRFVARRHEAGIDLALLPEVIPAIVKQGPGAVVVLGSQGIGKSTLARFLANALFSQHGVCYWLDLDLGQPEFSPPGVLSLHCVQGPLFCSHDTAKVKLVKSFFLGGSRLRCPIAAGIAIEQLCAFVEPLQRRYPVVVNTHGWVLSTGRRMTVEAIRRLRPRHIIHLVKESETRWARNSETLMDPTNGLNSGVLHRRFLVHRLAFDAAGNTDGDVIGRLPHPHPTMGNSSATMTGWRGMVHTVQVKREEGLLQQGKQIKASALRRSSWQRHLFPIFHYYATLDKRRRSTTAAPIRLAGDDESTTLFKGELKQFDAIVFADMMDVRDMTDEVVCAALEYSVVALSFSVGVSLPVAAVTNQQQQQPQQRGKHQQLKEGTLGNYRCLSDMPLGFPVSCFGFVESTESEMRTSGEIKIRLPFRRDILREMLTAGDGKERMHLSLAFTSADRADFAALEAYC